MNDMAKQAEYFIVSGSVPKLANYLEKITGEAAEIIKELRRERDEARYHLGITDRQGRAWHVLLRDDDSVSVYYTRDGDPAHYVVFDTLDKSARQERDKLVAAAGALVGKLDKAFDCPACGGEADNWATTHHNEGCQLEALRQALAALEK